MDTAAQKVTVAKLKELDEYRICQEIQRVAWGLRDDSYLVPVATMVAVNNYGGLVLGARRGDKLVGFSFAFLGRMHGEFVLYSQITAVLPEEQGRGLGYNLKLAQHEWAREHHLNLIAWAFDPLQAGNANFNLHKLGVRCRSYEPNMYGERSDELNAGRTATDRLIAEWDTRDTVYRPEIKLEDCEPVLLTHHEAGNFRRATHLELPDHKIGPLCLEIPESMRELVQQAPAEAHLWQGLVREAFEKLFALGYEAVDFVRYRNQTGECRGWYLLH